jgi:hypothetical protein
MPAFVRAFFPPGAAKLKIPFSFTADAHLDFLSFQPLPDPEGRNRQAAVLYLCLGGVLCAITCPESRHVLPRWSVATQRECIGSLRHKISFIRCKPLQYQGLTMCEKHTRLSQFASPLPLGVIRLTAVTWVRPELAFMARTTAVRDRQRPPAWCSFWAIEATAYIPNPCTPIEIAIH